ncbi:MAG: ABC transporter ATP-binding protein, partial [Clostridia bacterium]|nr:ABC transporter ATP-binding protein [Clostridia bacterium]
MLELEGLTRYYGSFLALDHLSITVGDGELHGFVGPNGAGKTTTLKILGTLLRPSEGTATLNGVEIGRHPRQIRRMMGYMPDFFGVYDRLKSWEYLDFYARCYGTPPRERSRVVGSLLELVSLSDKRDAYVDVLSRGMKQRLCLARALIHDPSLLILDEPASGMDPRARADMKGILRTLKDMGKTVLVSSHILPELSEMCDSLTIIDHGRRVFSGSVEELGSHMSGRAPIRLRLLPQEGSTPEEAAELLRQVPGVTGISQDEPHLLNI